MTMTNHPKLRRHDARVGFTLVEMLVVIAIIGVLAALLIPTIYSALGGAKTAALGVEVASISNAIEKYKSERGEYPPSLGEGNYENDTVWNTSVARLHIVNCYRNIDPGELLLFRRLANHLSQSEALVFFLTLTRDDARYPFFGASYPAVRRANIVNDLSDPNFVPFTRDATQTPLSQASPVYPAPPNANAYANPSPYKNYGFNFDAARLLDMTGDNDLDDVPSYVGKFCKAAVYIYCDARTYNMHYRDLYNPSLAAPYIPPYTALTASGEGTGAVTADQTRPYFADQQVANGPFNFQNAQTFQVIAAGLDGRFTNSLTGPYALKRLPSKRAITFSNGGANHTDAGIIPLDYWLDDRDNVANFSGGKKLDDLSP